jgi:hypothetical protein
MLVRERGRQEIFVETGKAPELDKLRADPAACLDLPSDARAALRRIKSAHFVNGRVIALLFTEIDQGLSEYENPSLTEAYGRRLQRFLTRHALPYRLDPSPIKLTPLLHGEVDGLYRSLRGKADSDPRISEALAAFEDAWERQSADWNQITAKDAIRTASLLAENMLVAASNGRMNEFTRALTAMRNNKQFPSNDFANIFERAYTFANNYPNIRHPGNPECVHRELRKEDALVSALIFLGLSAVVHELCEKNR